MACLSVCQDDRARAYWGPCTFHKIQHPWNGGLLDAPYHTALFDALGAILLANSLLRLLDTFKHTGCIHHSASQIPRGALSLWDVKIDMHVEINIMMYHVQASFARTPGCMMCERTAGVGRSYGLKEYNNASPVQGNILSRAARRLFSEATRLSTVALDVSVL